MAVVWLTMLLTAGVAEAAHFVAVTNRTGPSQPTVLSIAEDTRGFLWIGTQDGLNRFDGYEFKVYTRGTAAGLRDNWIGALAVAADGSLWVGNRRGIDRFDPDTETFAAVSLGVDDAVDVTEIRFEPDGDAWVATRTHGLLRIRSDGVSIDRREFFTDPASGQAHTEVNGTMRHSNGTIWVATSRAGLQILDDALEPVRTLLADLRDPGDELPVAIPRTIEGEAGTVWVATTGRGLLKLDSEGRIIERHVWREDRRDRLNTLMLDSRGTLWLATQSGVTELDPVSGLAYHNPPDRTDDSRLNDGWVNALFEDSGGTIWVGTWAAGLYRHNPEGDRFRVYKGLGDETRESGVGALAYDARGRLWILVHRQGRLLRFDPETETTHDVPHRERSTSALMSALYAAPDALYVGWADGAIDRLAFLDGRKEQLGAEEWLPASTIGGRIESMGIDDGGTLWVGTREDGLFAVEVGSRAVTHFEPTKEGEGGIAGAHVSHVLPVADGHVWLATSGGLQRFDTAGRRFRTFVGPAHGPGRLPEFLVTTVLRTSDGRIWVGTQGGGVAELVSDEGAGRFSTIDTSAGLASDAIGVLLEAADGGIWASTTRGLSRIDPVNRSVTNYYPADGTLDGGFFIGSGAAAASGRLYFGGPQGMLMADPGMIRRSASPPRVQFVGASVNGTPRKKVPRATGDTLELEPAASQVSLEFAALLAREPDMTTYAYRLVGHTDSWSQQPAGRRFATFFNLAPGTYRFEVRAREPEGDWSTPASVTVIKRPYWYASMPAKIVYGLVLMMLTGAAGSRFARKRAAKIRERQRREFELRDLAYVDQLTRLPNRVRLSAYLANRLDTLGRGETVHVLFVDLDHFKDINDSLGHQVGDRVLAHVARRLSEAVGPNARICRWGGDEFVALLDNQPPERAEATARAVIEAMLRPLTVGSYEFIVTACVGVAEAPQHGSETEAILHAAEAALYHAKQTGRNTWRLYDEDVARRALDRVAFERDLREAVARQSVRVVYQPLFDRSGRIVAAEALARWRRSPGEEVSPARFIPVAEDTGIILDLDRLVIETVLNDATALQQAGGQGFRFSVNLSALEFRRPDLADLVLSAVRSAGLAPDMLELEVTESALLSEPDNARRQIKRLRRHGITIAIDDFGTGYSALNYLTSINVDRLKIDRSFVTWIDTRTVDREIVAGVVQIAKSLDVEVVAEGVESESQLAILRELGCDLFQGFLLAQPLPFDKLEELLTRTARE